MPTQAPDPLQLALRDWESWPLAAKPDVVQPFNDGLINQAWLISCEGQPWVVKLFTDSGRDAIQIQQWAAKLQLAPEILFAAGDYSYAVMPYLANRPGPADFRVIADSLRCLHSQPAPVTNTSRNFALLDHCELYLLRADDRAVRQHESLLPILRRFADDDTPTVYCHNDLVAENMLLDGERCVFIDWEFAGLNNPWWDLASVSVYHRLDQAQAARFIRHYDETWSGLRWRSIGVAAQIAVLWLDLLWYLQQQGSSGWAGLEVKQARLQELAAELGVYF